MAYLVGPERDGGGREGEEVVNPSIRDECAERIGRGDVGPEQQDDRGVEHADAARDVAENPDRLRQEKCAEEEREAQFRGERKKRVENRAGERPVDR